MTDAQAERLILVLERIAAVMERPYSPLLDGPGLTPYVVPQPFDVGQRFQMVVPRQTYNTGDHPP